MTRDIPTSQLDLWLMELIQGDISEEDLLRLEGALADDIEVLDYCLDYLIVTAGLEWHGREMDRHDADRLMASLQRGRSLSARRVPLRRRILRGTLAVAAVLVLGVGLTLGLRYWRHQAKALPPGVAARIAASLSPQWAESAAASTLAPGTRTLVRGVVDLALEGGTRVVVKGPCRFRLIDARRLALVRGMISVRVPAQARGFRVETPGVHIVDLGTEFGVIARADGTVETHVFQGHVVLVPPGASVDGPQSLPLPAGVAAAIRPGWEVQKAGANPRRFLRDVPARATGAQAGRLFDLADVVGRGNGFGTGRIGRGVHPANGEALDQPVPSTTVEGVSGYIFLLSWRYLDGVFVPDGRRGRNAVSSTGLLFEACPDTNGRADLGICDGGFMAAPGDDQATTPPVLGGQRCGTAERPALGMPPNAGITFDLDRIRADNPGTTLDALRTQCGVSENVPQTAIEDVTFWVLVDGEVRFRQTVRAPGSSAVPVHVSLPAGARFLSLVTTCPGRTDYAWAVWGLPFLELGEMP